MKIVNDKILQETIGWTPHTSQVDVLNAYKEKREIVVIAGRRYGKSMLCAYILLRELLSSNKKCMLLAPSYDLCDKVLDYVKVWVRKFTLNIPIQTRPYPLITNPLTNSWVKGCSAEAPSSILGESYDVVIVDESALLNRKIFEQYIYPALTSKRGKVIFISTPRGKNWLYELFLANKESKDGASFQFPSTDNPFFPKEEFERAILKLPQDVVNQEFRAMFLEGTTSVFRNIRDCVGLDLEMGYKIGHQYVFGLDLAKVRDYSVLIGVDKSVYPYEVVHFDRFQKIPYPLQKERIYKTVKNYGNPVVVADVLNVGASVCDDLRSLGVMIVPFTSTGTISKDYQKRGTKDRLIEKLAMFFEDKLIKIPDNKILIDELEAFSVDVSQAGNLIYSAPVGLHDDSVFSLALSVWPLLGHSRHINKERNLEWEKKKPKKIFQYV